MDKSTALLKEKLERLLREAAEAAVALDRADGTVQDVPHYSVIEARAHTLGQELSREIQGRHMNEVAALRIPTAACPQCGIRCDLTPKKRQIRSVDGLLEVQELAGRCPFCRKSFFPGSGEIGFGRTGTHAAVDTADCRGGRGDAVV